MEHRVGKARMHDKAALSNGHTHHHGDVVLVDLPGVYSLHPRSEDEQVTRDVLAGEMPGIPKPDALLLILDCTNLGRHLVLAAPILSLKLPTLVILNMADDLKKPRRPGGHRRASQRGGALRRLRLISASKGQGIEKVFQFMEGASAGTTSLAPPPCRFPSCKIFRAADSGRTMQEPAPRIAHPRRPSGRAVWIPCSCILSPAL